MVKREFNFYPLTRSRWNDFEKLFGQRGACGGCWCMWWRVPRSEFNKNKGERNKKAMKNIVWSNDAPGIIAYERKRPIGWCSIAPREEFPALERSRILKRVDDKPVWSIVCFFVSKGYRKKGVSKSLIDASVRYAKKKGAKIVEGYPNDIKGKIMPDVFAWTGFANAFFKTGFKEVARRSKTRPIVRYFV